MLILSSILAVAKYGDSEAVNELTIKCGLCGKLITINYIRYHKHFGVNGKFYLINFNSRFPPG